MKTTNTARPKLGRLSMACICCGGVRWKIRGGIRAVCSVMRLPCAFSLRLFLAFLRTLGFLAVAVIAVVDACVTQVVAVPTGVGMAHARARWMHRWSRAARWVTGVRMEQRGVMPPSGIIAARYTSFFDAILLAAMGPCVFVACSEVRQWPVIGLLSRLGGTLFVNPRRRDDVARVNFLIERAVRRRLVVVIFSGCAAPEGSTLCSFASGLLQPAVELGCSLTAAVFGYQALCGGECAGMVITPEGGPFRQFAQLVERRRPLAIGAFHRPVLHHGDRKQLARQLRAEARDLIFRNSVAGGIAAAAHSLRGRGSAVGGLRSRMRSGCAGR